MPPLRSLPFMNPSKKERTTSFGCASRSWACLGAKMLSFPCIIVEPSRVGMTGESPGRRCRPGHRELTEAGSTSQHLGELFAQLNPLCRWTLSPGVAIRLALGWDLARPGWMRPVFADPKTDFVFKRIFGHESHQHLLIARRNDLLELDAEHCLVELTCRPSSACPCRSSS